MEVPALILLVRGHFGLKRSGTHKKILLHEQADNSGLFHIGVVRKNRDFVPIFLFF